MRIKSITALFSAAVLSLLSVGSIASAAEPTDDILDSFKTCDITKDFFYTQTATLHPGQSDVTSRDEIRGLDTDGDGKEEVYESLQVRVDGWAQLPTSLNKDATSWDDEGAGRPVLRSNLGVKFPTTFTDITFSFENVKEAVITPDGQGDRLKSPAYFANRYTIFTEKANVAEPPVVNGAFVSATEDSPLDLNRNESFSYEVNATPLDPTQPVKATYTVRGHYTTPEIGQACGNTPPAVADQCEALNWNIATAHYETGAIANPSNEAYLLTQEDLDRGLASIQHFGANTRVNNQILEGISWRVPIAFTNGVKAGTTLTLYAGEDQKFDTTYFENQTGMVTNNGQLAFARFVSTAKLLMFPNEIPYIQHEFSEDKIVLTFPEIQPRSHAIFQVITRPLSGNEFAEEVHVVNGVISGEYMEDPCVPWTPLTPAEPIDNPGPVDPADPVNPADPTEPADPAATKKLSSTGSNVAGLIALATVLSAAGLGALTLRRRHRA